MKVAIGIQKALQNNNQHMIDKFYEELHGYDSPENIGYKSKNDALKDAMNQYKSEAEQYARWAKECQKRAEELRDTPLNKLIKEDKKAIASGVTKTAFILNSVGSAALGTVLTKQGMTPINAAKAAIFMDALFTAGVGATASMFVDASERNKR